MSTRRISSVPTEIAPPPPVAEQGANLVRRACGKYGCRPLYASEILVSRIDLINRRPLFFLELPVKALPSFLVSRLCVCRFLDLSDVAEH